MSQSALRLTATSAPELYKLIARVGAAHGYRAGKLLSDIGLYVGQEDDQDGRVSRIQLTSKGRELQPVTEDAWEQLDQETLANLTVEEQYIPRRLLCKLEENLGQGD